MFKKIIAAVFFIVFTFVGDSTITSVFLAAAMKTPPFYSSMASSI